MKFRNGTGRMTQAKEVISIETTKNKMRRYQASMEVDKQLARFDRECGPVITYRLNEHGELVHAQ